MKPFTNLIECLLILSSLAITPFAQDVRPVRDNVGFCWNAKQMGRLINYLRSAETDPPAHAHIVAAISPHDDYLYAARVYYPLYRVLRAKEVVIFGVTHGDVRPEIGDPHNIIILDNFRYWHGPEHSISVSPLREYIKSKLDTSYFIVSDKAKRSSTRSRRCFPSCSTTTLKSKSHRSW